MEGGGVGRLRESVICTTAAVVVLGGSAGLSTLRDRPPSDCPAHSRTASNDGSAHAHGDSSQHDPAEVMVGASCNTVELVSPDSSTYVPDVAGASSADRAKARNLLDGVNEFCATHSLAQVEQEWRPGLANPSQPSHFFNPDRYARGLDPASPRAALVIDNELAGVVFTGRPLPPLGSIPRPHIHDPAMRVEMLHVYCTPNMKEAFTPNRQLGVNKDLQPLRLRIRPLINEVDEAQLQATLTLVRGYAGEELVPVTPVEPPATGGPDPVLQAMRIELRQSLMLLEEPDLRSLLGLLRSY
jgi:hypothetical protein